MTEAEIEPSYETSVIQKFYKGTHILITGGSGFLGKLLVEKLLRGCPDLSKLYLVIRPKRKKNPEERLEEMFQDCVFDRMKKEQPKFIEKIKLIHGDMEQPDMGINEEDRKLLAKEVNIIFHVAATVRFDEAIKKAAAINVRATRDLVEFSKTIVNLKIFVYVSTAFSYPFRKDIDENLYDVPISSDRLLKITEILNNEELAHLTPKLLGKWPNTYSFTKAIAENVSLEYGKGVPIIIIRPSMIISTYKEPVEAWINNFYGPVGFAMAGAAGLMRVSFTAGDNIGDVVPGDYVVNSMIVAAGHMGFKFNEDKKSHCDNNVDELQFLNDVPIFNYTSGSENPITWGQTADLGCKYYCQWPTVHAIWYGFALTTSNKYLYTILQFLLHKIPAYLVDIFLFVTGNEPRMVKAYKKLDIFVNTVSFFTTKEWIFNNNNTQILWKKQNKTDQKLFPFSSKELNWDDYFKVFSKGLRLYLFKDPLETLPQARRKYQKLKIAHYSVVTLFWLFVAFIAFNIFRVVLCKF